VESPHPAHEQRRGRATAMAGWLAAPTQLSGFLDGHGVLLCQVPHAPWWAPTAPASLRMHCIPLRLLQVVADYTRVSAVPGAGRAGDGRASMPQYPGLTRIARTRNRWPGGP